MSKITDIVESIAQPAVAQMGYELVDVEYKKENVGWVLTVFIDKQGGITVEDCEKVSRQLDSLLDEKDPIPQAYFLSVSSPGLDRPIKKDNDFTRNIGKKIVARTFTPMEGKKEFVGVLLCFDELSFTIRDDTSKEQTIQRKDAASIKPKLEY
ncbi:MAG: ribosome maturation factor RimP [Christensenellales bacterium]